MRKALEIIKGNLLAACIALMALLVLTPVAVAALNPLAACGVATSINIVGQQAYLTTARGQLITAPLSNASFDPAQACGSASHWRLLFDAGVGLTGAKPVGNSLWLLGHQNVLGRIDLASGRFSPISVSSDPSQTLLTLAASETNSQAWLLAGTRGHYWRSNNGGQTWQARDLYIDPEWDEPEDFNIYALTQLPSGHWLAAGELGTLYWSDNAEDWDKDETESGNTWFAAMALPSGGALVAGFGGVYGVVNQAQGDWQFKQTAEKRSIWVAKPVGDTVLLAGEGGVLYQASRADVGLLTKLESGTTAGILDLDWRGGQLYFATDKGVHRQAFTP